MTLRLDEDQVEALRRQAEAESRSMQTVVRAAVDEYLARRNKSAKIEHALATEIPRFAEALRRLGE